ncbi:hypothetical protein PHYSODRAFT_249765 [Plasmopara halstedii]|uniref:DDE-1 domain-containing protein n=1 Tax=Plasmopara halstedii TaxID=4781 RepID=A0A0P1A9T2_PLAHL|nr:hypothetical protein PHYSODRAFT_249765 [Plasmopara halstedii]CEG37592.1 hypothetical protein PHYSODRAFT_249765 [Plasmopara halstedii]|eukprot:XP_024573961.1 hypothetical protein PHYSODRAFT_249765 [Plasmopara halstedii]
MARYGLSLRRRTNLTILTDKVGIERAVSYMRFLQDQRPRLDLDQTVLMDETAEYFEDARNQTVDFVGARHVIVCSTGFASMRITVILAVSAASKKLPPILIWEGADKASFKEIDGVYVTYQKKAWVDGLLLKRWIDLQFSMAVDKKELTLYFKNFIHDDKDMLKRLMDQLNEFPVSIETENLKKAVKEYIDVEPSYRYLARQLVVERQIVKERFVDLFPIRNTNGEKLLKHELFQTWDHLMTWNGEDFGQFILSRLRMQFSDPDIVHLLVKLESEHVASYSQIKVETALFAGLEANRNQNAMAALQIHRLYVEKGRDLLNTAQLRIALTYYQKKYAGRKVIKFKNFGQVRCTYHIIKGSSGNRDVLLREVIKVSSEPWQ